MIWIWGTGSQQKNYMSVCAWLLLKSMVNNQKHKMDHLFYPVKFYFIVKLINFLMWVGLLACHCEVGASDSNGVCFVQCFSPRLHAVSTDTNVSTYEIAYTCAFAVPRALIGMLMTFGSYLFHLPCFCLLFSLLAHHPSHVCFILLHSFPKNKG